MIKTCVICGREFNACRRTTVCSEACRLKRRALRSAAESQRQKENRAPVIRTCAICGKDFQAYSNAKTCSDECRKILRSHTKNEAAKAAYERAKQKRAELSGWLTIPDAPNYEINSKLQVRNKKTGKLIAPYSAPNRTTKIVSLYTLNGYTKHLTAITWRRKAEAAVANDTFIPIYSTNGKYEINTRGTVRNASTKKIIKEHARCFYLFVDGKYRPRSKNSLLIETFGIAQKNATPIVPVVLSKGDKRIFFESKIAAARFLAPKLFYAVNTLRHIIAKQNFFEGWHIHRLDDDVFNSCQRNNTAARHDSYVWGGSS